VIEIVSDEKPKKYFLLLSLGCLISQVPINLAGKIVQI